MLSLQRHSDAEKKKNGKKKEMTPQGKYHVYSLNISSNK